MKLKYLVPLICAGATIAACAALNQPAQQSYAVPESLPQPVESVGMADMGEGAVYVAGAAAAAESASNEFREQIGILLERSGWKPNPHQVDQVAGDLATIYTHDNPTGQECQRSAAFPKLRQHLAMTYPRTKGQGVQDAVAFAACAEADAMRNLQKAAQDTAKI